MALVTSKELAAHAHENGYCVPAINTQGGSYDIIRAICEAAEEAHSPMMLAQYANNIHYYGMEWFATTAKYWAEKVSVPVALHLDHGETYEQCVEAVENGYTSVMIDCSRDSIEDNIKKTNQVIEMARPQGVSVEAEVGELVRLDGDGAARENNNLANVEDVKKFVAGCQPDLLAVGIGNAHGFYKGEPNLRLDVLQEIRDCTDIPLVMHGATGIPEHMVKDAIKIGIAKINFGTLVRHRYFEYYREEIEKETNAHSWKVAKATKDRLKDVITGIIELAESGDRY